MSNDLDNNEHNLFEDDLEGAEYVYESDKSFHEDSEEWFNDIKYEDLLDISYLENIEYLHKSDEKFVLLDKKINKKIVVTKDTIGNIEELIKANSNLRILNKHGYKIGDYVELDLSQFSSNQNSLNQFVLCNHEITFYIDDVEISIRAASDMFVILTDIKFGYYIYADNFTISLKGINENNYADHLNQSLFMISMISQNDYLIKNEKDNRKINEIINSHYISKNYNEVFYFYNEAMRIFEREISSLYLYKILEYFFLIARKNEFEVIIKDYNKDRDMNVYMKNTLKIYKDGELEQLIILVNSIKDELSSILRKAKELNILDSYDITYFSKELYSYRNSIVHGKSDNKFVLKIPNELFESEKDLFWKNSLKYISEVLLFKYCIKLKLA